MPTLLQQYLSFITISKTREPPQICLANQETDHGTHTRRQERGRDRPDPRAASSQSSGGVRRGRRGAPPGCDRRTPHRRLCAVCAARRHRRAAALDTFAGDLRATHPHFVYAPHGEAQALHNAGRLAWGSGPRGEAPVYTGLDVIITRDGKIAALYVFLDPVQSWRVTCLR